MDRNRGGRRKGQHRSSPRARAWRTWQRTDGGRRGLWRMLNSCIVFPTVVCEFPSLQVLIERASREPCSCVTTRCPDCNRHYSYRRAYYLCSIFYVNRAILSFTVKSRIKHGQTGRTLTEMKGQIERGRPAFWTSYSDAALAVRVWLS